MFSLIAIIKTTPENRDMIKEKCVEIVEPSKKEYGCLHYHFYKDNNEENTFMFVQTWANYEHWQTHMTTEHLKNLVSIIGTNGCELTVHQLTEIKE